MSKRNNRHDRQQQSIQNEMQEAIEGQSLNGPESLHDQAQRAINSAVEAVNAEAGQAAIKKVENFARENNIGRFAPGMPEHVPQDEVYRPRNIRVILLRPMKLQTQEFNEKLRRILEEEAMGVHGLRTGFSQSCDRPYDIEQPVRNTPSSAQFSVRESGEREVDNLMHEWNTGVESYRAELIRVKGSSTAARIKPEDVTIDVLFYEPNMTNSAPRVAWKGENLFPVFYSGIESRCDKQLIGEYIADNVWVEFQLGGKFIRNSDVMELARKHLEGLQTKQ